MSEDRPEGGTLNELNVMKGCYEWTIQCRRKLPCTHQQSLKASPQ